MAKRHIKLNIGDIVDHEEFGIGTVERACATPGLFGVAFSEGQKLIKETSTNFKTVNGKTLGALKRQLLTDEAYEASSYQRYSKALFPPGEDFSIAETAEPELVAALDAFCIDKGLMKIGCNPSYEPQAIQQLTALGVPELASYLQIGQDGGEGEEAHGFWMNLFIPDPMIADIDVRLRMFFNPRLLVSKGVYTISKLSYNRRLLGKVTMQGAPEDEGGEDLVLNG